MFVTSYRPSQLQTHILKVTNQARWPFGKIKDTFLKKKKRDTVDLLYYANNHGDLCYTGQKYEGVGIEDLRSES